MHLDKSEVTARKEAGEAYVVRLKVLIQKPKQ